MRPKTGIKRAQESVAFSEQVLHDVPGADSDVIVVSPRFCVRRRGREQFIEPRSQFAG